MRFRSSAVAILTAGIALGACDLLGPEDLPITRVTVPICVPAQTSGAVFFYYRNDGDSEWIAPPRNLVDSTFTIDATSRVTLAWSSVSGGWTVLRISVDELQKTECNPPAAATPPTHNGSLQNWRSDETVQITIGRWYTSTSPSPTQTFTPSFTATPRVSPFDAFAYATSPSGNRIIARRAISASDGSTLPAFDFASSEPLPLATMKVASSQLGQGETGTVQVMYESSRLSQVSLGVASVSPSTVETTLPRLPASVESPDDLYWVIFSVNGRNSPSEGTYLRSVTSHVAPAATYNVFPGPIPVKPVLQRAPSAVASHNTVNMSAAVQDEYAAWAHATISAVGVGWHSITTQGYRRNNGTWELSIPADIPNATYPAAGTTLACSWYVHGLSFTRLFRRRHLGDIDRVGRAPCTVS